MPTRLSFILPCYNVERYIGDCLESIYAQDLAEEEFEVICVNDCSTDGTRDVILSKQALHSNLILLDQPRNMYSGAARNRGLEVASSDYIWFVDSDDMVKPNMAKHLLDLAYQESLDLLFFNFDEFIDGKSDIFIAREDIFRESGVEPGSEFVERHFDCKLGRLSLLWLRLFKRSLILDNKIAFPDLYISQDGPFAWETLLLAKRVKAIKERCYNYRSNPTSITANKNTAKKMAVWSFQFPFQLLRIKNRVSGVVPEGIIEELERSIRYEVNQFVERYRNLPQSERHAYYISLRNAEGWYSTFSDYLTRKNQVIYLFSLLGERFFNIVNRKNN